MLKRNELKEIASKHKIKLSSVEKDYTQNWLIKQLNSIDIAMKGGTGLRKVYFKEYRFSEDLDFTLLTDVSLWQLTKKLNIAIELAKEESGINFASVALDKETDTGYKYKVGFQISQDIIIQIDITKKENDPLLLPVEERMILHNYPERFEGRIKSYDIREILLEKIRALFERGFPRDLYDVGFLLENRVTIDKYLLMEKFSLRDVMFDLKNFKTKEEKIRKAWASSLANQINPVPDFNRFWNICIVNFEML